jgi:hypothetical protein
MKNLLPRHDGRERFYFNKAEDWIRKSGEEREFEDRSRRRVWEAVDEGTAIVRSGGTSHRLKWKGQCPDHVAR